MNETIITSDGDHLKITVDSSISDDEKVSLFLSVAQWLDNHEGHAEIEEIIDAVYQKMTEQRNTDDKSE